MAKEFNNLIDLLDKDNKISRRVLLKGGAYTLLGMATIPLLAACGQKTEGSKGGVASGAKPETPKPSETPKKQKVRIGYLTGAQLHQFALPVALEKGYFAEEGLEVEKLEFASGGMLTQQFSELDAGLLGIEPAMIAKTQGVDIVVVTNLHWGGSALVVDPSITKFEDLKDKPIGTPGVATIQYGLLTMLENKYKTPTKKLTVKVTDMPIYARNKEIVGAIAWEPFPSSVMEMAGFKRLLGSNDILENQQCCVWATSKKAINERRDMVEKLVKINAKATRYLLNYPEEAIKIIAKYSGQKESLTATAFQNMIYPWPPAINEKSSRIILQNLIDSKRVDPGKIGSDLDAWWNDVYDKSFEKELIASGYIAKLEKEGVPK